MSAIYLQPGLRVRIVELKREGNPLTPLPSLSGFTEGAEYPVLGAIEHGPDGELWLIVAADGGEIWRLSQRHCRYVRT
jgi:hypothetical protein